MRCSELAKLPPPPGKSGWPWTVETLQLPLVRKDGSAWPRISIVLWGCKLMIVAELKLLLISIG